MTGLALRASPYPFHKGKPQTSWHPSHWLSNWLKREERKETKNKKMKEWKFSIVDKRETRRRVILTGSRGKNCRARRNCGLAASYTSGDTLPTVLDTVNKCVCEMLWRMFCIKETKYQCEVQWQQAQLAEWHNMPSSNKALHCIAGLFFLYMPR